MTCIYESFGSACENQCKYMTKTFDVTIPAGYKEDMSVVHKLKKCFYITATITALSGITKQSAMALVRLCKLFSYVTSHCSSSQCPFRQ